MIVGWTRDVQPIFIFKWSKRPLDSGGGRCDHHHFYLSEQCFGTISKKYRHYSETFRHCSESEYSLCFRRLFQLPTSKNNQNSLRSLNIRFSSAHFAHLIGKEMWAGSQRPTPKSMGQNGPLISIGTIPKKVVGIVPNIVPHIVPNIIPIVQLSQIN